MFTARSKRLKYGMFFFAFKITLLYGDINEMLRYLMYIFGQVLHTFCFSLQGQKLINHSIQLHDKM